MKSARRRLDALADQLTALPVAAGTTALTETLLGFLGERYARAAATGDTYTSGLATYLRWAATTAVDPVLVTRQQASRFVLWLAETPSGHTGQIRSPSARNTILTAASQFLEYATDAELRPDVGRNPFRAVTRPQVHRRRHRPGPRLTLGDLGQLVLAARTDHILGGTLGKIIIGILGLVGIRPGDLCRLNLDGATDDGNGGYELNLVVKRGKPLLRWLPPQIAADLYTYLRRQRVEPDEDQAAADPSGTIPLLVHPRLRRRVTRDDVLHLVKRSSVRAGLPAGAALTAREFRALFLTAARAAGADLEDRQLAAGHDDPRTTRGYDHTTWARERDPALKVAALVEDYPSEERSRPLSWATASARRDPGGKWECDCTPAWKHLRIWLGDLHDDLDEYARAEISSEWEPGTDGLPKPSCPVCHAIYIGPYMITAIPGDLDGQLLALCRAQLAERLLYPAAVERRAERERRDPGEQDATG